MAWHLFRTSKSAILCFAAALGISTGAQAAMEKIEYAYPDISVWTTERDESGKLKNPLVKLAGPLFEKAGIPWQAQDYPAKRMFANLREGISKFSMLVNAPTLLQDCCLVSKDPVAVVEIRAFYKKGTPPILTREDLQGKNVITIRGYSYAGTLQYIQDAQNRVTNYAAPNHFAAFSMFNSGRADYVLDYAFPAAEVLSAKPIEDIEFTTLKKTNVHLILHKDYPDAENVMAKLEEIAKTLDKEEFLNSPDITH